MINQLCVLLNTAVDIVCEALFTVLLVQTYLITLLWL